MQSNTSLLRRWQRLIALILCSALLVLSGAWARTAYAATITVTTTSDVIDPNDDACSLREAIIAANTNTPSGPGANECAAGSDTGTDTITLADGVTYTLSIGGSQEEESATGDLDIVDNSAATDVILTAGGGSATISQSARDRVLHILSGTVEIDGLTLTGGRVDIAIQFGGGIYNSGTLTLNASTISGNSVNYGGGLHNDGVITLNNSTVSANSATNSGGGIYSAETGTVTLNSSTVSDNSAVDGGGIVHRPTATLTLSSSTISDNSATHVGGGIAVRPGSTTTIEDSTISGNSAPTGGGIYNAGVDTAIVTPLTLNNSTVSGNTATTNGGGIFIGDPAAMFLIENNSIIGGDTTAEANTAVNGGGGIMVEQGTVTIEDSTVSGNTVTFDGGGLYNYVAGDVTFDNSTVSGNSADRGGGVFNTNILSVENGSVIGGDTAGEANTATTGGGIYNASGSTAIDASTVSGNATLGNGGGIYNNATLDINNGSTIGGDSAAEGNKTTTSAGSGGGIYNNSSTTTVDASTVSGNSADVDGGGIFNNTGFVIVRNGSTIGGATAGEGNIAQAGFGGGIYNASGTTAIDASTVSGNTAITSGGGIANASTLDLQHNSIISGNAATNFGGGIYNVSTGTITATTSIFLSNSSGSGGGAVSNSNTTINSVQIAGGCIVGNTSAMLTSAGPQNASGNWWGHPTGANPPGSGDSVSGNWNTSGHLTTPPFAGCSDHLTVQGSGAGSGTITDTTPGGLINCAWNGTTSSGDCDEYETEGDDTVFTLVATPAAGSTFAGWTGCPSPSGNTCDLTLSSDTTVTSTFSVVPNLLQNGSFEQATGFMPDFWTGSNLNLSATVDGQDCSTASEGSCSMRFKGNGNGSKITQEVLVSGAAGDDYLLEFDTMSNNAGGSGRYRVQVKFFHTDGSKKTYSLNLPVGTHGWTAWQLPVTATKPYTKLQVIIEYSQTKGFVWFDDFILIP
jgi:CSLREA domain-containing protein